jgi:hypothetical protein
MAARAQPRKCSSATAKRRPTTRRPAAGRKLAARRKPAARRGASRIHWDRVGRVALTLVLFAVLYSYLNPVIDFVKTYTTTTTARIQLHEAQHENSRLHWRIQHADDPITLDARARAQGMVAPEETPLVVRGL